MGEKMKGVHVSYDDENDVLYFHFDKPKPAISREVADGVFLRVDPDTDQTVGFTILGFRKKTLEQRGLDLIPMGRDLLGARS
jgi:uncharacterized protein YuzE